jgi:hypothetical protein
MKKSIRFVGLDVHAETIAVAVAEPDGEVRSLGTIRNRPEAIRKLVKKLCGNVAASVGLVVDHARLNLFDYDVLPTVARDISQLRHPTLCEE